MKAVIFDGGGPDDTLTPPVRDALAGVLSGAGWDVHTYTLHNHKIAYCTGCFGCWVKTPGQCVIRDDNNDIAADVLRSDLYVLLSRVRFGSYSAQLKRMVDHMIPLILPFFKRIDGEIHHHARYDRYPNMLGIGLQTTDNPAQAAIFRQLITRNAINLHCDHAAALVAAAPFQAAQIAADALQIVQQMHPMEVRA